MLAHRTLERGPPRLLERRHQEVSTTTSTDGAARRVGGGFGAESIVGGIVLVTMTLLISEFSNCAIASPAKIPCVASV